MPSGKGGDYLKLFLLYWREREREGGMGRALLDVSLAWTVVSSHDWEKQLSLVMTACLPAAGLVCSCSLYLNSHSLGHWGPQPSPSVFSIRLQWMAIRRTLDRTPAVTEANCDRLLPAHLGESMNTKQFIAEEIFCDLCILGTKLVCDWKRKEKMCTFLLVITKTSDCTLISRAALLLLVVLLHVPHVTQSYFKVSFSKLSQFGKWEVMKQLPRYWIST